MKTIFVSIVSLILSSCGNSYSISGFESYVNEFVEYGKTKNKKIETYELSIGFGKSEEFEEDVIGICYIYESGDKDIAIKKEYWDKANEIQKKVLMFHELGHCLLGLDHDDTFLNPPGRPKSFMNSHVVNWNIAKKYYSEYMEELFSR